MKKLKKSKVQNSAQLLEQDAALAFVMKLEKEKLSKDEFLKAVILTKNILSPIVVELSLVEAME